MSRGGQRIFADPVLAGGPVVLAPAPPAEAEQLSPREREIERRALAEGRSEGFRLGREAGLDEGRRAAEAELASAAGALAQAMRDLAAQRQRFLAGAKEAVLRLALAVARKIVHREVHGGGTAARVIEAALSSACEATALRVRLSPQDREHVVQASRLQGPDGQARCLPHVELVADPSISPGGCVVETDCGSIDAQVETQWGEVQAALEGATAQILAGESESVGA